MYQPGLKAIRDALNKNHTLVSLAVTQFGQLVNELTREDIRRRLEENRAAVPEEEEAAVKEVEMPAHITEIYSVYRTHS